VLTERLAGTTIEELDQAEAALAGAEATLAARRVSALRLDVRADAIPGHADDVLRHHAVSILLSGFVFPYDGMPVAAQIAAQILPLTHFLLLVRGIVLKGAELGELLTPMRNLGIMFAIAMTISILRFRKRLD